MTVRIEGSENYTFYSPKDTTNILYSEIQKKGEWVFNQRRNREEKRNWCYECKNEFIKNPALLFSRFTPETLISQEKGENKDKHLQLVLKEFDRLQKSGIVVHVGIRCAQTIKDLSQNGYKVESFDTICHWRLIIGLGASHPEETSMTLHHIYGIPYIPGSAVKGVTRHWTVHKFAEEKAKRESKDFEKTLEEVAEALEKGKELNDLSVNNTKFTEIIRIFGTQKKQGEVIFMDAFPVGKVNLTIDIINPHYQEYYSNSKPPADWQSPNPIKFLTVEKTRFTFSLLSKDENILKIALNCLKEALKHFGIGAKTSLGYGIFEFHDEYPI